MTNLQKWSLAGAAVVVGGLAVAAIIVAAKESSRSATAGAPGGPDAVMVGLADPDEVYDPVKAGEPLPSGYRQLLDRDQIAPVYAPTFAAAGDVAWPPDSLVIGVAGQDGAKAYPVTHLNRHEMVIDSLDGIPILVSW